MAITSSAAFAQTAPHKIRVALFVDRGANIHKQLHDELFSARDMKINTIYGEDVRQGCLNDFDVLFVPGGLGKKEAASLAEDGREEVRRFVAAGGIYVGICAGCYLLSEGNPTFLGLLPLTTVDSKHWHRGKATLPVEFTPLGMEIFGLDKSYNKVVYHNGPILRPVSQAAAEQVTPLAFYRREIVAANGKEGVMVGAPAIFFGRYKQGYVLGISPHPEVTPGMEEAEKHAIRWLYSKSHLN